MRYEKINKQYTQIYNKQYKTNEKYKKKHVSFRMLFKL